MTNKTERVSRVTRRAATHEGANALAAAALGWRVAELLNQALQASSLKNNDLAKRLDVSESRVSQVLHGDGNLYVATVGRFLRACGYELELALKPVVAEARPVSLVPRKGLRADLFSQCYATSAGVATELVMMHNETIESAEPLGRPKHVATSAPGNKGWQFVDSDPLEDWVETAARAVAAEGAGRLSVGG